MNLFFATGQNWGLFFLALIAISVITTANYFKMKKNLRFNKKKNEELQKKLEDKEQMRINLLKKVINTQEEERKRIARELHDETSQSLTSLLVVLKMMQQDNDIKEVNKLANSGREIIYNTLEEIKRLSYELRPMILDEFGLKVALDSYIRELSKHIGRDIAYKVDNCDSFRLNPILETTVYRVVQEALTNARRHSQADHIEVMLLCNAREINVTIRDDGCGFDLDYILQKKQHQALGLFGMMERAALIDGKISIDSAPGKGTRIFLQVPLEGGSPPPLPQDT